MNNTPQEEWRSFGNHSVRFERPDIVHMRIKGDLTTEQVEQLLSIDDAFPKLSNGAFALIDIAEAGRPNLEILKSPRIMNKMKEYRAFVYYRALFQHRTVIDLVRKVGRALNLSINDTPLMAFATESEARVWIGLERGRKT